MKAVDIELLPCGSAGVEQYARLARAAFHFGPKTVEEWSRDIEGDPRCDADRYFLAQVGGEVVGGFRILPLEMKVGQPRADEDSGWIQVGGLGRMGVYPHYRRLGYAGGVMRLVLQRSWQQGDVLSLVYPTSFDFCRRYGYGIAARHLLYGVPPRSFPDSPQREHVRPLRSGDLEGINRCYETQIPESSGIIRRDPGVWRDVYLSRSPDDGYAHYVFDAGDGTEAYLCVHHKKPASAFFRQEATVLEWFPSTQRALLACLGFFRAQSANLDLIKLLRPPNCALETVLTEPVWPDDADREPWQQPIGKLCSTLMGRIVRLHEAIAARDYAGDGRVNLIVEDWVLSDNSGYWALDVKDGRGRLERARDSDPEVRLDISVLSSLYCGVLTAEQALLYGLVDASADAARRLDAMLGRTAFIIWDHF